VLSRMIDITESKITPISEAKSGRLLLSQVDQVWHFGVHAAGGFLGFYVKLFSEVPVAFLSETPTAICIDIGAAVVSWPDGFEISPAAAVPGSLILDGNGLSIMGLDESDNRRAWTLATGELHTGVRAGQVVISKWEIGLRSEDGKFTSLVAFPKGEWVFGSL
jgi:hypothetical protein